MKDEQNVRSDGRSMAASQVAAALLLGLLAGGQVVAQQQPADDDQAQAPASIESTLPADDGRREVIATCSKCHALGMVVSQGRSPEQWTETILRMRGFGAVFTERDGALINAYLTKHFPAQQGDDFDSLMAKAAIDGEAKYPHPQGPAQVPSYGMGNDNQNFSTLTDINKHNVAQLDVAWIYHYGTGEHDMGDQGLDYRFEVTPLLIGGIMYLSTPSSPQAPDVPSSISALDPQTGEQIWKFESPFNIHGRGIAYWPGDDDTAPRIIFGTQGGYLLAVDVTTGALVSKFGRNGVIDAYVGVSSEIVGESRRATFTIPNPVTIYDDLVITGSRPGESGPPGPRGDIRAFSARTGRLQWTFHTAPLPGEPHADLSANPEENFGVTGANVWSTMTLDEQSGVLYAPLGDLNARVTGPEAFSSSLVALNARTGKLVWYRQITHKDMWDWDLPTPPVLLDYNVDGESVPAVLQTGKHGLVFLFDRRTGEPLNGYEERPTPRTNLPGVDPWPTQPFPNAPGPVARTGMERDEIPDLVPGMRAHCQALWDEHDPVSEGLYALSRVDRATITAPGSTGGPNWGGGSYNPGLGYYFINVQNRIRFSLPSPRAGNFITRSRVPENMQRPEPTSSPSGQAPERRRARFSFSYTYDGERISCGATPWGELVAVDLRNLKIAWRSPLGISPELGNAGLKTGARNLGGSMATESGLVFIGASNDRHFRAFDATTGDVLWDTVLPASAHSTPITYKGSDGRQYIVIAAGGGTSVGGPRMSDSLVAFALSGGGH